jgi:hypothetical protein
MRRPLAWLLLACGIGSAIILGFALSAPQISILAVVVAAWLALASVILLATTGGASADAFAAKTRLIASQTALLGFVAFGIYVLRRGREPWPGAVLLGAAALTEAILIILIAKAGRRSRAR